MPSATALVRLVGGVRVGVGAVLIVRPAIARVDDATSRLLVRTIGIRDIVLGLGTLLADRDARAGWMRAGLTSDVADAALVAGSGRELGAGRVIAMLSPLPMIAAGVAYRRTSVEPQP